ncbi:ABC transporter substrate-binding protein [Desulfitobacterium sp. AusDCA]|uniref:ABC transporter substrate-binding protein n=1 Tax=Desulfitobacterium sp. AusDCA TaxID=3240383 RepID=UPI003DA73A2C
MFRKQRLIIVSLIFALLALTGCSTPMKSASSQTQTSAQNQLQVNASYSTRPINVPAIVALEQHNFESEFQKNGTQFKWVDIAAGPSQLEALASKSIDISTSMNYVSALLAKANGNDIKVVGGYSQFPKGIGIVARKDLNVTSMTGLKNRTIALQQGTMLQEFLVKALEKEHLNASDVKMVSMESTDAVTTLMAGQVDAAILPEPLLSKVISSGKGNLVLTAEGFITGQTFIVARSEFVNSHPEVIRQFLKLNDENIQWAEQNKENFYDVASKQLSLDPKAVQALYPKFTFQTKIDSEMIRHLKESAHFLQENGFIKPQVDVDTLVNDLADTSFSQ